VQEKDIKAIRKILVAKYGFQGQGLKAKYY